MARAQPLVAAQPNVDKLVEDHLAVQSLIRAYQVRPHLPAGSTSMTKGPQVMCHVTRSLGRQKQNMPEAKEPGLTQSDPA